MADPEAPGILDATTLDPDDVRRAAQELLGRTIRDLSFTARAIDPELRLHSVTAGVNRVSGLAEGTEFSVIVKGTRRGTDADPDALWVSGDDPSHRNYWKREWLAYSSGLLGRLPGRLRAPRLLHATEPAANVAVLYLEDVGGRHGTSWRSADYAGAAHDLGTTQGALAADPSGLPDDAWLSRRWLAEWIRTTARWWPLVDDDAMWRDERLSSLAPLRRRARQVWHRRAELLDIVDTAPQTLVHLDFWPTNVIAADDGSTVAIDWSSVGIGSIAQDLDQLTLDPVWMQVLPGADLDELERSVLPPYDAGLRASGLDVTGNAVRRCYAAAAGLRYTSVLPTQADIATDPERVTGYERRWGRPFRAIAEDRARVVRRALDLAEEAL